MMGVQLDSWIEKVKLCEYLAEDELKALCEYVRTYVTGQQCTGLQRTLAACCALCFQPSVCMHGCK